MRHTRHDRFPIIKEENWASSSSNLHRLTVSPDRRRPPRKCDPEVGEQSDRSTAESVHSDYAKRSDDGTIPGVSELEDRDSVDCKLPFARSETRDKPDKRKSHTLPPQGGHPSLHERPLLSESRTVDILRDYSMYDRPGPSHIGPISENRFVAGRINSLEHAHEGRVRNISESSTSGVSSCDSVLGRYAFP